MGAMRAVVHSRVMFLCLNKGGSITLGWLRCVGGVEDDNVGV